MTIPKTLGGQIDALYKRRLERLALEKKVKAMKAAEGELHEVILKGIAEQRSTAVRGKLATASAVTKVVGKVADWPALYAWIAKHDAFELLQRRLNNAAWLERAEASPVPGVTSETVVELSLTKAGS